MGLEGERLDAALARMFGLSRSRAASWSPPAGDRRRLVGREVRSGRGRRVARGRAAPSDAHQRPRGCRAGAGLRVVYDDDDMVVVDKPVGVAGPSQPGWTGPTVVGGLAGAGYRVATSGAAERQGVVHRLDVGTSGLMVVAKSELAYSGSSTPSASDRGQALPRAGPGSSRPAARHGRRSDRPASEHDSRWAVVAGGRPSVTHYDTIEAFPGATLLDILLETGRTHQIRGTWPRCAIPASAISPTEPTPRRRDSVSTGSGCTRSDSASTIRAPGSASSSPRLPDDLRHAWTCSIEE